MQSAHSLYDFHVVFAQFTSKNNFFLFLFFSISNSMELKKIIVLLFFVPKHTEVYINGPKKQI